MRVTDTDRGAGRIRELLWDEFEVSEFLLHDSAAFGMEDEYGARIFRAGDGRLAAEVIVLPDRGVVCFTIRDAEEGRIVLDLSVQAHTELSVRRDRQDRTAEYLYCQECTVLPGLHGYASRPRYLFYERLMVAGPVLSLRFTVAPGVSLRFLDTAHDNRAIR